ncbi:MAG: hypothetical protein JWN38_594 [Candidatus Saccharibacteria bacterium]|nr:hypothetical protein [Candidatus Saccharibacteria bacterium]
MSDDAILQNPHLASLAVLVGKWHVQVTNASFLPSLQDSIEGAASFAWLGGGAFLAMRSEMYAPGPPKSFTIIGRDMKQAEYSALYYDERGVSRTMEMDFIGGIWKMWRDALDNPFSQRFEGHLSADNNTITAQWEKSFNNQDWELDFDIIYTRIT